MTIRDLVKRRTRLIMAVAFGAWLPLPVTAIISEGHEPPTPLLFAAFAVFGGAILAMLFRNRCPKCRTPLGQLAFEIAFHWGTRRRVNFCPYCGVKLDETYEAPRKVR